MEDRLRLAEIVGEQRGEIQADGQGRFVQRRRNRVRRRGDRAAANHQARAVAVLVMTLLFILVLLVPGVFVLHAAGVLVAAAGCGSRRARALADRESGGSDRENEHHPEEHRPTDSMTNGPG